jgi:diguanylate cyclase (GGDEF)-like protein
MERLFIFAYLIERTALDELALDEALGATGEAWPLVAQLIRRGSFEMLGAYTERARLEPSDTTVVDPLTTLYTRPLFDAVLAKEIERASRTGDPISLILFDVDHLSRINETHGHGVGDRILERLGITLRKYFRRHDWVARYGDDSIAVLLIRTEPDVAADLAERVRRTVEERLELTDHRGDPTVAVTLSAAVLNLTIAAGDVVDPDRLLGDAEAVLLRAKQSGRNQIARVDSYVPYSSS